MSDPLNHLGSIWYHSDIPEFVSWFVLFVASYIKTALVLQPFHSFSKGLQQGTKKL